MALEFPIPHGQESLNLEEIYTPLASCINQYLYKYNDYLRTVVFYNDLSSESRIVDYQKSLIRNWPEQYALENSLDMAVYTPPSQGALSFLPSIDQIKSYERYKSQNQEINYAPLQKSRYWNTILNVIWFLISGKAGWGGQLSDSSVPNLWKLVPIFSEIEPTQITGFILNQNKHKKHTQPVDWTTYNAYDYRKMVSGSEPNQQLGTVELDGRNFPRREEGTADLSSIAKQYYSQFTTQNFIYPPLSSGDRLQHSAFFNHIWAMLKALNTVSYIHWENLRSKFLIEWSSVNESDDHSSCTASLFDAAASTPLSSAVGLFGIHGEPSEEPRITENPAPDVLNNYRGSIYSELDGNSDGEIVEEGFGYTAAYTEDFGWYGLDFTETLTNGVTDLAYTSGLQSKILCYVVENNNTDLTVDVEENPDVDYSFHDGYFQGLILGDIIIVTNFGDTGDKTSWDTSLPQSETIQGPNGTDFPRSPEGYPSEALNNLVECEGIDTALGDEFDQGDIYSIEFTARYYSIVALLPEGCSSI
jgi:hypothetical protein